METFTIRIFTVNGKPKYSVQHELSLLNSVFFFFTILGNVSPGAKSSRCLLEDLQQLIHWISGKTPKQFNNAPNIVIILRELRTEYFRIAVLV